MQNQAAKDDPIAARKAMLDRVVSDFTFKANQTDDQKTLWNSVDQHFSIFHINERIRLCESVANDYDDKFDMDTDFQEIAYPGPQTNPVNESCNKTYPDSTAWTRFVCRGHCDARGARLAT